MIRSTTTTLATLASAILLLFSPNPLTAQESTPRLVIDPGGPGAMTWDVRFTPDGSTLISVGTDKNIRFWDVETGDLRKTIRLDINDGHEGKFFAGAMSPKGDLLAVAGWAQTADERYGDIRLINIHTGKLEYMLRGHTNVIYDLEFSPDGNWLASGGADYSVRVWDMRNLAPGNGDFTEIWDSEAMEGHSDYVYAVSFSPDNNRLVSGSFDRSLILWERSSEGSSFQSTATMDHHDAEVRCAGFSPDGRFIVSGSYDQKLLLWDGNTGELLKTLADDMGFKVSNMCFSPDGTKVLASSQASAKGYIGIFDLASGNLIKQLNKHTNLGLASAWHPNGGIIATSGGDDNEILLWNYNTDEDLHRIKSDGQTGWAVAFSTEGGVSVAFGNALSEERTLATAPLTRTFDFNTMTLSHIEGDQQFPAGFSRGIYELGGKSLVFIDNNHLDTGSGTIESTRDQDGQIRSYSFTPDGNVVVGMDFSMRLYNAYGEELLQFIGHQGEVWSLSPSPDGRYLVSCSQDQTVRLWNLKTGEQLATLFAASNDEWVCWTPSGHYHASAGGEKYIGWHINKGLEHVADYYPSYVFREQFQDPRLVKRSILLGDFQKALAEVGVSDSPDLADVLPPHIDWVLPSGTTRSLNTSEVTVQARIESPNANLEEIKLLVNGKAVVSDFKATGNSMIYEQTVSLLPGENRISIFARNSRAGHTSDERVVNVRGSGAPTLTTLTKPLTGDNLDDLLKPNLYVLCVGVSKYEIDSIPSLEYCDDDATAIANFFEAQAEGIFGKTQVKLLTNEKATEGAVQDGLDWLQDNATQQDFVILFLAAHGVNDERGNFYLLPHDANPDRLRSTGVAWDDFGDILGNLPSRVLMFLDTCHSGRLGANLFTMANVDGVRTRSLTGLRSAFDPTEAIRELTSEENGVVIMAASTGDEESMEHDDWGHGAFTMGLLQGLGGKADVNGDGIVHLRELDFFVSDNVKVLTGGRQHPTTVKPSTISRLPVARVK